MEDKEIKRIIQKKNVVILNDNKKAGFKSKNGVIIIEYTDNTETILDFDCGANITKCGYLRVKETNFTKEKVIFSNSNYFVREKYRLAQVDEDDFEDIGLLVPNEKK